jgi:hypothetical protein
MWRPEEYDGSGSSPLTSAYYFLSGYPLGSAYLVFLQAVLPVPRFTAGIESTRLYSTWMDPIETGPFDGVQLYTAGFNRSAALVRYSLAGHGQDTHLVRTTAHAAQGAFCEYDEVTLTYVPLVPQNSANIQKHRLGMLMNVGIGNRVNTTV